MHARSALFDLFGDHLRGRGGSAPIAALIRLLEPLGIQPPAVRTAVSRMAAQGWLAPADLDGTAGYALTGRARVRLDEAANRIYRTGDSAWDGRWHLRVLGPVPDRRQRERVRGQLRFLGLAPVSDSTWVSPRPSREADALLGEQGLGTVSLSTDDAGPAEALLAAYDVESLSDEYVRWLASAQRLVAVSREASDERAFAARFELVHGWRKFLFSDPGLPPVLLPEDWPGHAAAAFFDEHSTRLLPPASRFVDQCLCRPRRS